MTPPVACKPTRKPLLVLIASLFVPGAGHVLIGQAQRGLAFLFFAAVFGWLSLRLMPDTSSFAGRHIGAIFIWGLAALDAYKLARISESIRRWGAKGGT